MSRTDSDAHTQPMEALVAALSRQYEVMREIGRGGMATVYLATERRHGRSVALKVMHPELTASIGADRFEREVRIAAGLTHPNILPLFDSGEAGGFLFYAMPFVEGESLRRRLERTHELPIADAIAIARGVADALGHAHARGFIHRDVKPENILLAGNHPLLADFGIARALGASTSGDVTQSGHVVGSPRYMSPEQASADKLIDGRSDLYSLGCVLFEMLVGAPPYSGDNAMRLMSKHVADPIPATGAFRGDVPAALERVITRALAKSPDDRFPSALAMITALDAATRPAAPHALSALADTPVNRVTYTRGLSGPEWTVPVRRGEAAAPVGSIAVLPFTDMSQAKDQEFFCDGMTEDLRATLARLPGLRVASRTSAMAYNGRAVDARTVGRELDVAAVLEGTVQQIGTRLRITASLIGTADGFQLWSESFDRDTTDIFAVQDDITRSVATSLSVTLSRSRPSLVPHTTSNVEAYQLYLRGRHFWARRQGDGLQRAVECYRQALELDPLYVMPYVGLADAFNSFGAYEHLPPKDAFPKVIAAAERALSLDATLAEAHTALGCARGHYSWDWRQAEDSLRQALALNPQYSLAHAYYALVHAACGRHERAQDAIARAQQLDPLSPIFSALVGWVAYHGRRTTDAIHQLQFTIEMEPGFKVLHSFLGFAFLAAQRVDDALAQFSALIEYPASLGGLGHTYGLLGRRDEALAVLAEMDRRAEVGYSSAYNRSLVYLGLGDRESALDWIERGAEERSYRLSFLAVEPILDPLRNEPRFIAVQARMGLGNVTHSSGAP